MPLSTFHWSAILTAIAGAVTIILAGTASAFSTSTPTNRSLVEATILALGFFGGNFLVFLLILWTRSRQRQRFDRQTRAENRRHRRAVRFANHRTAAGNRTPANEEGIELGNMSPPPVADWVADVAAQVTVPGPVYPANYRLPRFPPRPAHLRSRRGKGAISVVVPNNVVSPDAQSRAVRGRPSTPFNRNFADEEVVLGADNEVTLGAERNDSASPARRQNVVAVGLSQLDVFDRKPVPPPKDTPIHVPAMPAYVPANFHVNDSMEAPGGVMFPRPPTVLSSPFLHARRQADFRAAQQDAAFAAERLRVQTKVKRAADGARQAAALRLKEEKQNADVEQDAVLGAVSSAVEGKGKLAYSRHHLSNVIKRAANTVATNAKGELAVPAVQLPLTPTSMGRKVLAKMHNAEGPVKKYDAYLSSSSSAVEESLDGLSSYGGSEDGYGSDDWYAGYGSDVESDEELEEQGEAVRSSVALPERVRFTR